MNYAAANVGVQLSFPDSSSVPLDKYPEVGLLDLMIVPFLVF